MNLRLGTREWMRAPTCTKPLRQWPCKSQSGQLHSKQVRTFNQEEGSSHQQANSKSSRGFCATSTCQEAFMLPCLPGPHSQEQLQHRNNLYNFVTWLHGSKLQLLGGRLGRASTMMASMLCGLRSASTATQWNMHRTARRLLTGRLRRQEQLCKLKCAA